MQIDYSKINSINDFNISKNTGTPQCQLKLKEAVKIMNDILENEEGMDCYSIRLDCVERIEVFLKQFENRNISIGMDSINEVSTGDYSIPMGELD